MLSAVYGAGFRAAPQASFPFFAARGRLPAGRAPRLVRLADPNDTVDKTDTTDTLYFSATLRASDS